MPANTLAWNRVLRPGGRAVVFDKWVPEGRRPSLLRSIANVAASAAAPSITRRLGDVLAPASFVAEHREPAGIGGFFSISLLRKP